MARKQKVLDVRISTRGSRFPGDPTVTKIHMTVRNRKNTMSYTPYVELVPCGFSNLINVAIHAADAVSFIRF